MSKKRRRKTNSVTIWSWIYFIIFGLITSWLLASIFTQQHPISLLGKIKSDLIGDTLHTYYSANDYKKIIIQKEDEISLLKSKVDSLNSSVPEKLALVRVDSPSLNMRADASLVSDIIMQIPNGTAVEFLYFDTQQFFLEGLPGKWCKIKHAGNEGWVWGNFLELKE